MATKKRGLGRNLGGLISSNAVSAAVGAAGRDGELRNLPMDVIQGGRYQPRKDMHPESLEDLASSIRAQGLVQPIVVRKLPTPGRYEIIAGERRWRASQLAGLHEIPAMVRDVPDEAALVMALIENIQREDLNPIEEANALRRLAEEFELTHQQVADAVGRSRVAVSNLLRLLTLNDDVRALVEQGQLEMGHARALLGLEGEAQSQAARTAAAKGLSVRETEQMVRRMQRPSSAGAGKARPDPDVRRLQDDLGGRLGARVWIKHGAKGRGRLVIEYSSLDELEGILTHIK